MSSTQARRIGIMGGTFDPIHYGHLVCAEEARVQFRLDEVIFVPAGAPWQKREFSPPADRLEMTRIGTASNPSFSVSAIETERPGPTYTVETLDDFRKLHPEPAELFFITGADAVLEILTWKDAGEVLEKAHFIAATRPDYDLSKLEEAGLAARVSLMQIPALAISSTDIRARVAGGRPIRYLLPDGVAGYIREHGLYGKSPRAEKTPKAAGESRAQAAGHGYSGHSESADEGHNLTESRDRALLAAQAAASKKAQDVVILDVAELIGITDYFVICSGANERQVATLVDEVERRLRAEGVKPYRREGEHEHRWVLLDYVDIVVHVFHAEEREFYELERLWKDAGRVDFEDEAAAAGG